MASNRRSRSPSSAESKQEQTCKDKRAHANDDVRVHNRTCFGVAHTFRRRVQTLFGRAPNPNARNYKFPLYKCQLYKDLISHTEPYPLLGVTAHRSHLFLMIIRFSDVAHPKIRLEPECE